MPDFFRQNLSEVISELNKNHEFSRPTGLKLPGPLCNIDQETFDLLLCSYKSGQYCRGVVTGFLRVKDMATPEDLLKASRAVHKLRRSVGKHQVVITLFQDEMEDLKKVAEASSLKPAGVLEATAFLYFRAKDRQSNSISPGLPPQT
jgi:hypothetical protein